MAVKVCGAVLSSLFYDQSNSKSDQEGILLGKVVSSKTDAISDSQISTVKEEISTYVYAYITCGSSLSWYDSAGRVCLDELKPLLKNHSSRDVIGWYKFRRNSSMAISLRERSVHKYLKETFPGISDQNFLFLLCGMQATSVRQSTYSLDHMFYISNNRKFRSVKSEIINLGDTSHNEYKMQPSMTVNTETGAFSSTMQEASTRLGSSNAVVSSESTLNSLNTTVTEKLQKLCWEVNTTEESLGTLRKEINEIKQKLKLKEEHQKSMFTPLPEPPEIKKPKTTGAVPKVVLDKIEVPPSSSRQKRLSSGSSPSQRKILDFDHQDSLFDIRSGTETLSQGDTGNNVNYDSRNKSAVAEGKAETLEAVMDLICLEDNSGNIKENKVQNHEKDLKKDYKTMSGTNQKYSKGTSATHNQEVNMSATHQQRSKGGMSSMQQQPSKGMSATYDEQIKQHLIVNNSSDESSSQSESISILSPDTQSNSTYNNVKAQNNPFLMTDESEMLKPQKLYNDKPKENLVTKDNEKGKEDSSKDNPFMELENVARKHFPKVTTKGNILPKSAKDVQNIDFKKASNSLQQGASLKSNQDNKAMNQRSARGQIAQHRRDVNSSIMESDISVADDILSVDSSD